MKFKPCYQYKLLSKEVRLDKSRQIGNYYHVYCTGRQKLVHQRVEVRQPDARIQNYEAVKTHMVLIVMVPVMQQPQPKELHKDVSNHLRKQ